MCEMLSAWHVAGALSMSAVLLFCTRNSLCDFKGHVEFKLMEIRKIACLGRSMGLSNTRESMIFLNVSTIFDLQCLYTCPPPHHYHQREKIL